MLDIIGAWKSVSIRTKITSSFFLTTLLGVFLISLYANFMSNRILIEKSIGDYLGILHQFSEKLDSSLSHANSLTKLAITNNIIQENLAVDPERLNQAETHANQIAINLTLARLVENSSVLSGMVIYSLQDERAFYSRGFQEYEVMDRAGRELVLSSFHKEEHIFWRDVTPHIYRIYDEDISGLRLYRRLFLATNGKLNALIESIIDERYIKSLYENILTVQDSSLLIINEQGIIVSSPDKSLLFKDLSDTHLFRIAVDNKNNGQVYSRDKHEYLAVSIFYKPLGWYIIGEIPIHSLQNEIRMITGQIFLAGLATVILSLLIASRLSKSLTRPILSLQKSVSESGLDINVRAEVTNNDEIGQLACEYNAMLDKQQAMMERLVEEQKILRRYELSLLQAQINPHFLYNALENICGLIDLNRKDDAHDLINEISRFYRVVLSEGSSIITIREELRLTEHYINILNVRYNNKIDYIQEVPEELMINPIVKMTLQPLIENAIYHGLKSISPPWTIHLKIYLSGTSVVLELRDNGVGIDQDKASDSEFFGFGTKSTAERLKLYFGEKSGLCIRAGEEKGTLVTIVLPPLEIEG